MTKYKAVVIGSGRATVVVDAKMQGFSIGYSHGNALSNHSQVELVSVADISEDNAKAFAERFGVPRVYTDYKKMIDQEQPDIVSICTWPTLHLEMTVYAAKAGVKMIWCEKPMAVGIDEVDEMVRVCKENGTRLFINHQRRYDWSYQVSRKMIDEGALGKVDRIESWVGDGWDLMSWGTHWVDMHRFLLHDEDIDWVVAAAPHSGDTRYGHPVESHMLLQFQFKSGVISVIHLGSHLIGAGMRIIGSEGTVSFNDGGGNFILHHVNDPKDVYAKYINEVPRVNGMHAALEDIIHAFESGELGQIDASIGSKSTEIVMAAYQASVLGRKLTIPLEDRTFNLLKHYK